MAEALRRSRSCISCGGYIFGRPRHKECPPTYSRSRFLNCDVCGTMARGRRHKKCNTAPSGFNPCGYCGEPTRGDYHVGCRPMGLGTLAIFPDLPNIVQRRCTACLDWFPFVAIAPEEQRTGEFFSPHGTLRDGRSYWSTVCRGCVAERRKHQRGTVAA